MYSKFKSVSSIDPYWRLLKRTEPYLALKKIFIQLYRKVFFLRIYCAHPFLIDLTPTLKILPSSTVTKIDKCRLRAKQSAFPQSRFRKLLK